MVEANRIYCAECWCFCESRGRTYLHEDLRSMSTPCPPHRAPGALWDPSPDWAQSSSRAALWRGDPTQTGLQGTPSTPWACSMSVPFPGDGDGPGACQSVWDLARWSTPNFPPSFPPSICSSASQLPALVPDVLSAAPGGSWKQKMVLPLASAQPAHVPAGKS